MIDDKIIIDRNDNRNCSRRCKNLRIFYIPRCIKFGKSMSFAGEYSTNLKIKRCNDCLNLTMGLK